MPFRLKPQPIETNQGYGLLNVQLGGTQHAAAPVRYGLLGLPDISREQMNQPSQWRRTPTRLGTPMQDIGAVGSRGQGDLGGDYSAAEEARRRFREELEQPKHELSGFGTAGNMIGQGPQIDPRTIAYVMERSTDPNVLKAVFELITPRRQVASNATRIDGTGPNGRGPMLDALRRRTPERITRPMAERAGGGLALASTEPAALGRAMPDALVAAPRYQNLAVPRDGIGGVAQSAPAVPYAAQSQTPLQPDADVQRFQPPAVTENVVDQPLGRSEDQRISRVTTTMEPGSKGYNLVEPVERELGERMDDIIARLNALPDDEMIVLSDGDIVSGAELKTIANGLSFTLTDEDFGDHAAGKNEPLFDNADNVVGANVTININRANSYRLQASGPLTGSGLNQLILHEITHAVELGRAANDHYYRRFVDPGGDPDAYQGSPPFVDNERYANRGAAVLGARIDVPVFPLPRFGL